MWLVKPAPLSACGRAQVRAGGAALDPPDLPLQGVLELGVQAASCSVQRFQADQAVVDRRAQLHLCRKQAGSTEGSHSVANTLCVLLSACSRRQPWAATTQQGIHQPVCNETDHLLPRYRCELAADAVQGV